MNKQERNKKLAEWRFPLDKRYVSDNIVVYKGDYNEVGDFLNGRHTPIVMDLLTESLDACFKWPVPQALEVLAQRGYVPPIMKLFQLWYDELVSLTGDSSNTQRAALALCLAIEKLIDQDG